MVHGLYFDVKPLPVSLCSIRRLSNEFVCPIYIFPDLFFNTYTIIIRECLGVNPPRRTLPTELIARELYFSTKQYIM